MYTNAKLSLVSFLQENKVASFADTNLWWPDYCLKAGGTQQIEMISREAYVPILDSSIEAIEKVNNKNWSTKLMFFYEKNQKDSNRELTLNDDKQRFF